MSGAALGIITAVALAATAPQQPLGAGQDVRFGAKRPAQAPLFERTPPARVEASPQPRPVCRTPVVHGDNASDPRFVHPVPKGEGVPAFTMRWAPSTPCDPARSMGEKPGTSAPKVPR